MTELAAGGIDAPATIAKELAAIARLAMVPKLLEVCCNVTGMRFAALARVTANSWTCCAVRDDIGLGIQPGTQLDVQNTLCFEVRAARTTLVFDRASAEPRYREHPAQQRCPFESYISVPIVLAGGRYFGNLWALDPERRPISDPKMVTMVEGFAQLVALELEDEFGREQVRTELRDERATSELREQFIAILGHDLRNPLQAVDATAHLLERRLTDSVLVNMANRIRGNVRRMSSLIDDVLDFARARLGGGIGVQMQQCDDVEESLVRVVEELQDSHPERRITLDAAVTRPVVCDIARLQQVMSNLVANALAHGSPQSAIGVTMTTTVDDLVLQVWNDGEPIPEENMGKMFEPFWRPTTSGVRQGLGLGLHICAQIVHAHGGRILVSSSRGAGTQFTVQMPLRPAASA